MSEFTSAASSSPAVEFEGHLDRFLGDLAKAGYAVGTVRGKRRLLGPFIRWACEYGIAPRELDQSRVDAFLRSPSGRLYKQRTALKQFVEHLRRAGVAPPTCQEPSPGESLVHKFLDHLRDARGLSAHSLAAYSPFVHSFVTATGLPESVEALDASAVRSHVLASSSDYSASSVKLQAAALRSFLRFCFLNGTATRDLSIAVPPVGRWKAAASAPILSGQEVEKVIAEVDRSTRRGCRASCAFSYRR